MSPLVSRRVGVATASNPKQERDVYDAKNSLLYSYNAFHPARRLIYIRNQTTPSDSLQKMTTSPHVSYIYSVILQNSIFNSLVGFDVEWKPTFTKGSPTNRIACIQLANEDSVVIYQVSGLKSLPEQLVRLLQDASIMKVGVGISRQSQEVIRKLH